MSKRYEIELSEYGRLVIYLAESSWYKGVARNRCAFLNRHDAVAWAKFQARGFVDFKNWYSSTDDYPSLKNYDDAQNPDGTHLSPTFIASWEGGYVRVEKMEAGTLADTGVKCQ